MSAAQHTPGPWFAHGEVCLIGLPGLRTEEWCGRVEAALAVGGREFNGAVCEIQTCNHVRGIPSHEGEANARLIAAAPDMYDVLADLAECATTSETPGFARDDTWDEFVVRARAAIAKAKGGAE